MKREINARIIITDGKIEEIGLKELVPSKNPNCFDITTHMNTFQGLLILQSIINDAVNNYEKEFQKTFIPDEKTIYKLPKDE